MLTEHRYDPFKEMHARKAREARAHEEGKRKQYEGRMTRKAKREGKDPLFYLKQGASNPTVEILQRLRAMPKDDAFAEWKAKHSQHCFEFHFNPAQCKRDRACAFFHADPSFVSGDAE
jgi:hypothetical protein